jgi:uncharacterized membrane protein
MNMKRLSKYGLCIGVWVVELVLALYLGSSLPSDARIPSHWNVQGEMDGTMSLTMGVWFPLGIGALILGVFLAFPWISPRYREQEERLNRVMSDICLLLMLGFAIIHLLSLRLAVNPPFANNGKWILIVIGGMMVGLGNLLPKVPQNYFVGVRLPWTLSDEENWRRTHRAAGWCFSLGGLALALSGLLPLGVYRLAAVIGAIVLLTLPVGFSYLFFLKGKRVRP